MKWFWSIETNGHWGFLGHDQSSQRKSEDSAQLILEDFLGYGRTNFDKKTFLKHKIGKRKKRDVYTSKLTKEGS